jgi:UDP-glucose 4-epimerase
MKILVTGGAGFIGSYLVDKLVNDGHEVFVLDNLTPSGGIPFVHPGCVFINQSIAEEQTWNQMPNIDFDVIYHLAAQTSGEKSQYNPREDMDANALGTLLVSRFAAENNVKHLIYMSTSAVYGPGCTDIVTEDSPPLPNSVYGVNKLSGEYFVKQAHQASGLDYTIFRLTNCYGPGEDISIMNKGMVSIFCTMALHGKVIHSKGSKDRYRNFIYVGDVINALTLAMLNPKSYNETFLLSTGEKVTVEDLISVIINSFALPKDHPVLYDGSTSGDTFGFHADIKKIQEKLGWSPRVDIVEGIKLYSEYLETVDLSRDLKLSHPLIET